jgi:3'-5' exoribonuclease
MKDFYVADAARYENKAITSYFSVAFKQVRSKRENGAYLALALADKTGQLEARMWENFEKSATEFEAGDIVKVQAQVSRFADKLQLKVDKIRRATPDEFTLADFVPHTVRDIDELWAELNGFVASFTDPHLFQLVRGFLDDPEYADRLRQAPAAKSMHHAFIGGLLEHIVSILGLCDSIASHYPGVHRDLLLTGAIFHDMGKLTELSWGTSFDYTMEGQLLGHITIGVGLIDRRIAEISGFPERLRILVQHIILSHHGQYEYGSPKLPMVREAILLNFIDDIDAKMQIMDNELRRSSESGRDPAGMTEWVRAMERPLLSTYDYLKESVPARIEDDAPTASAVPAGGEKTHALPFED